MSQTEEPGRILRLTVGPDADGSRIDRWLASQLVEHSRSRLQDWIRAGRVLVDGRAVRSSRSLAEGEVIEIALPPPVTPVLTPLAIPLSVLYEDDHLLVVVKPAGLQVHPGAGAPRPTLAHALLHRYPDWTPPGPPERPGIIHRLDRDTSGLLLVARSLLAYRRLARQIMARQVTRRYVALVWGIPELDSGRVDAPIGRDPRDRRRMAVLRGGRPASTEWRVIRRFATLTLLDVVLATGRTHQIRVHLSHLGHPVFGDATYGGGRIRLERVEPNRRSLYGSRLRRLNRQALHAYHLAFWHPESGKRLRFEAPVPADMEAVLTDLTQEGSDS